VQTMSTGDSLAISSCGVQHGETSPSACPLCEDVRNPLGHGDRHRWTTLAQLRADHRNVFREDNGFVGVGTEPSVGFGQRALLVPWQGSNLLWDCVTLFDEETATEIERRGGLAGIAVSKPHYHGSMVEWAQRFDCPIHLHEGDRGWVMREDPRVRYWSGDRHDLGEGLTLVHTGGHFAGAQVLHVAPRSALLVGDTVVTCLDPDWVSFHLAWAQLPGGGKAQLLPLDEYAVRRIAQALRPYSFEILLSAWWEQAVPRGADEMVRRSAERYVRALRGELSARRHPPTGGLAPA